MNSCPLLPNTSGQFALNHAQWTSGKPPFHGQPTSSCKSIGAMGDGRLSNQLIMFVLGVPSGAATSVLPLAAAIAMAATGSSEAAANSRISDRQSAQWACGAISTFSPSRMNVTSRAPSATIFSPSNSTPFNALVPKSNPIVFIPL